MWGTTKSAAVARGTQTPAAAAGVSQERPLPGSVPAPTAHVRRGFRQAVGASPRARPGPSPQSESSCAKPITKEPQRNTRISTTSVQFDSLSRYAAVDSSINRGLAVGTTKSAAVARCTQTPAAVAGVSQEKASARVRPSPNCACPSWVPPGRGCITAGPPESFAAA